jgi:hypothetical protein
MLFYTIVSNALIVIDEESFTLVNVPVLSEQMTETEPRVSTVFNDLQRILFFLIILATMVKLVVSAIGRPSGMKATAAETQLTIRRGTLIQSGWSFRSQAALHQVSKAQPVVTRYLTIE